MPEFLCATCGVQYATSEQPPEVCIICSDERQYVGLNGQRWLTLDEVRSNHHNIFTPLIPNLTSIVTEPAFGINQRAHVVQTPSFNMLWDCITLVDPVTVSKVDEMGGLKAMALSHPHYYSTIIEWSHAFGKIPIYIHADDREWVTRPDPVIEFWEGETLELENGLTLIRCGGHFEGSTVLHWQGGLEGKGVLLSGDTVTVVSDRRYASFMYSYPNLIPLPADKVQHIVDALEPFEFEQVYDAFAKIITTDGKAAVKRSAERYIKTIQG